jgi:uncharacterized protein (TIGR02265 family)
MIGNQASCNEDSGFGTKEELQRRLSLATPTDTVRGFAINNTLGPKQLLEHVPVAFRAAASFGESTVRWTSPKSGVLATRGDFLLHLSHEGGLMSLFRTLKIQGAWVRGRQVGPLANEVEFSWE